MSGVRDAWVRAAALIAALLPVYFLCVALATRAGLLSWRIGFAMLTLAAGPPLAAAALGLGAIGLALAGAIKPRRGWRLALFAIAAPGLALLIVAGPALAARRAPPLHDVSTDLVDPPRFSAAVAAERAMVPGSNSLDLAHERTPDDPAYGPAAGRLASEVQQAAFPDIQPIAVGAPQARALAAARGAALALGWSVDRVDETGGLIEARVVSFWYGFVDDIAIRVTPSGPGAAVIDIRAASRTAKIDLGANADRIRAFSAEVARQLARG